jgi:lambda repressor-like predicted transcriptional regulator
VDNHLVDVNKNIINKKRNSKQIFLHEKAIFENFVKKIKSHNIRSKKILFRTHPKKKIENSLKIIKKYKSICSISKNDDLFKDIAKSEMVVGWNSMAMFIADKLGKKVMHILPKGFKDNKLPIKDIMYLE